MPYQLHNAQTSVKDAVCAVCRQLSRYRGVMPGEKGWRSPLPDWWADEVNQRLKRRKLDKRTLAAALQAAGHRVSESMVVRALLEDRDKRIATLETMNTISDALAVPRPVVVASTIDEARELQATLAFSEADAEALRIASTLPGDADETSPMGEGVARAPRTRPQTLKRSTRSR